MTDSAAPSWSQISRISRWFDLRSRSGPDARRREISDLIVTRESAFVEIDAEGAAQFVSNAACERLGWSAQDIVGRRVVDFVHRDDIAPLAAALAQVWRFGPGAPDSVRFRARRGEGGFMVVEAKVHLLKDPHGYPERVIGVFRDITPQVRAIDNLNARDALLSAVSKVSGVGGWEWRRDRRAVYLTPVSQRLLGLSGDARPSRSQVMRLLGGAERRRLLRAARRAFEQGEGWSLDLAARRADGAACVLRVTGGVAATAQGRLVGGLQDVTRERGLEAELRAARDEAERAAAEAETARARLFDAVQALPDGFALYDADDRLVLCNRPFKESFRGFATQIEPGMRHDDLVRAALAAQRFPDAIGREAEWARTRCETRRPGGESEYRDAEGGWVRCVDRETSEGGVVSLRIDITAQKRHESWLSLTRDAAEDAVEARARFMANLSHELRSSLNGLTGMLSLLQQREVESEQRDRVQTAQRSARHLLSLLNDVLDYSSLEAGAVTTHLTPVRLGDAAGEVRDLFDAAARDKGLKLTLTLAPTLPDWVMTDATRLRQVLTNLVSNAVKFTDLGEVEIALDWSAPEQVARIEVRDTGLGVGDGELAHLFERFYRAKGAPPRAGSGLGLSICRQVVEQLGGSISARAREGGGTIFAVELPAPACASPQTALAPETSGRSLPIGLVVSEDLSLRARIATVLRGCGLRTLFAADEAEAQRLLLGAAPRLVVLDARAQGGDALGFIDAMRRATEREIQFLLLGASSQTEHAALSPDCSDQELAEAAHAAIGRAEAADSAEAAFRRLLVEIGSSAPAGET